MNEKQLQLELNKLDGGLFVDKEFDSYGRLFYTIKHFPKGAEKPFTALDWRYPDGEPKPLSPDILSVLHAQEGSILEASKRAAVENAVKKEKAREKLAQDVEDIAREHQHENRKGKIIPVPPRGAGG